MARKKRDMKVTATSHAKVDDEGVEAEPAAKQGEGELSAAEIDLERLKRQDTRLTRIEVRVQRLLEAAITS